MLEEHIPPRHHLDSSGKSKHRFARYWWFKIKRFLFGQRPSSTTMISEIDSHLPMIEAESTHISIAQETEKTSLKEWFKAIDVLQPLVHSVRSEMDVNRLNEFDLEMLGASTYLYHIDRLLVKIREHFLNLRYRQEQFSLQEDVLNKYEFVQVRQSCVQCHHTILNLITMIQKLPKKRLYSEEFISQIHALELETTALGSAMRSLNQFAYRQESVLQITQLEQSLIHSLVQTQSPGVPSAQFNELNFYSHNMTNVNMEMIRSKVKQLPHQYDIALIEKIVDVHDTLKKCYVVARKAVIKDTLDMMAESIITLMDLLSNENPDSKIFTHQLSLIFNHIESLRFSANRDSRCSRNLFEKAKVARQQLRKACINHPLGQTFIKQIALSRVTILK